MDVYISDDPADEAGSALAALLRRYEDAPLLLMLSGGSALSLLAHDGLLAFLSQRSFDSQLCITVLDERYSTEPHENNFQVLAQTEFFSRAKAAGASFIDTRVVADESRSALAERFEVALRAWRAAHPAGAVVATQGIGEDGHTAGILPMPETAGRFRELFESRKRWVAHYRASGRRDHPERVSVTLPFLREHVARSIVYAAGEEKRAALETACAPHGTLSETPARILREMQNAAVFTDQKVCI